MAIKKSNQSTVTMLVPWDLCSLYSYKCPEDRWPLAQLVLQFTAWSLCIVCSSTCIDHRCSSVAMQFSTEQLDMANVTQSMSGDTPVDTLDNNGDLKATTSGSSFRFLSLSNNDKLVFILFCSTNLFGGCYFTLLVPFFPNQVCYTITMIPVLRLHQLIIFVPVSCWLWICFAQFVFIVQLNHKLKNFFQFFAGIRRELL